MIQFDFIYSFILKKQRQTNKQNDQLFNKKISKENCVQINTNPETKNCSFNFVKIGLKMKKKKRMIRMMMMLMMKEAKKTVGKNQIIF